MTVAGDLTNALISLTEVQQRVDKIGCRAGHHQMWC